MRHLVLGSAAMDLPPLDPKAIPEPYPGLTYEELVAIIDAVLETEMSDDDVSFYLQTVELTLPGADVEELLFWPDQWFRDESMSEVDLNEFQIANYLLAWTRRMLPGSERITLPEIPTSKEATRN